jgi:hypothetical protein
LSSSLKNVIFIKASVISSIKEETGGKIISLNGKLSLEDLPNFSKNKKRFISEIPEADFYKEDLIGFWHTHPSYSIPSPPDFYQMIKLNLMFRKNFLMVIIGKKRISITEFKKLIFPIIRFEKIKTA